MDIALFAYRRTGIAGDFTALRITDTGVDQPFLIACAAFAIALFIVLFAISNSEEEVRLHFGPMRLASGGHCFVLSR
jgi:hypothetical protein